MSGAKSFQASPEDNSELEKLIRRFREAEAALQSILNGQVDAILDPVTALPVLLQAAQAYLVTSDARYRRILSRNTVVVFELAADGTTLFVNDAVFDMLGYTPQELQGRHWWNVLLAKDQHQQLEELYRQFQTGDVTQYELRLVTKAGAIALIELNTVNRWKPDRSLNQVLGLALDITERRRAEDELREQHEYLEQLSTKRIAELIQANSALQQLADLRQQLLVIEQAARLESEQANKIKVQFLATITHELRTPLTSIKGFASTLLATDVSWDTEKGRSFITIIDQEADNLIELIEQLLDSTRLQTGTLRMQVKPCNLTEIIDLALPQLQSLTAQHQFITYVPPNLPLTRADKQRMAQVLVNLVGNAAKFSPPGTRITLSATQQATTVQVDVSDEGPGIDVKNRERVFETFWQPEMPTTQHSKGLGLGLAISKGIIVAHGGKIWVAEVKSGTTMSFTLPIVR